MSFVIQDIKLEQNVYAPGDVINGMVLLRADQPMNLSDIRIKMKGRCDISTRQYKMTSESRGVFWNNKVCLDITRDIANPEMNIVRTQRTEYPFAVRLPENLPSTFTGLYGGIQYWIKAEATTFDDDSAKRYAKLDILAPLPLELYAIRLPTFASSEQLVVGCVPCLSGTVTIELDTDRQGYLPGETILISGKVKNASHCKIRSTTASLVRVVRYCPSGSDKPPNGCEQTEETQSLCCFISRGSVGHRRVQYWNKEKLQILPWQPPTVLSRKHFIMIQYQVELRAYINSCQEVYTRAEVTLGTCYLESPVPSLCLPLDKSPAVTQSEKETDHERGDWIFPADYTLAAKHASRKFLHKLYTTFKLQPLLQGAQSSAKQMSQKIRRKLLRKRRDRNKSVIYVKKQKLLSTIKFTRTNSQDVKSSKSLPDISKLMRGKDINTLFYQHHLKRKSVSLDEAMTDSAQEQPQAHHHTHGKAAEHGSSEDEYVAFDTDAILRAAQRTSAAQPREMIYSRPWDSPGYMHDGQTRAKVYKPRRRKRRRKTNKTVALIQTGNRSTTTTDDDSSCEGTSSSSDDFWS